MSKPEKKNGNGLPRILLVDDEEHFRSSLARQLSVRGYEVVQASTGEGAIKQVRHKLPEVVILDQKMPGMDGIQTLKEIKKIRPEMQVVMLTGYASTESAVTTGKHDIYRYLEKPSSLAEIIATIEEARQERLYAMARHDITEIKRNSWLEWMIGVPNARPGLMILGVIIFAAFLLMPTPARLEAYLSTPKTGQAGELIGGYSDYQKMKTGQSVADFYSRKAGVYKTETNAQGQKTSRPLTPAELAFRAKAMVGCLAVAALFWATGAIPIGFTALLVGVIMYFFGVFPPNLVVKAFAKDSVFFIFGVLAMSAAISKTGLDRRIGILLLGTSNTVTKFLLIFAPLLAMTASFLSEHALVAFLAPIIMLVYMGAVKSGGIKKDKALVVMMMLTLTYAANVGGPGSPAAGGRNAVMLGILSDYGYAVSFGQWVKAGFPFVPVMALVIGLYFWVSLSGKIKSKGLNIASQVRQEASKIGPMTADEYKAAFVLILLILLWTTASNTLGMGGPVLLCLVILNVLGIIRWRDVNNIHFDIVALYAAASAMGDGLASTGAALWLADGFIRILPGFLMTGSGLEISTSFITGVLTNFMSDGATVAAVGPITVPMAALAGASPIKVGLATAFASSFAHMLIIGTPNNAIAYSLARDPETGEQLLTMKDFLIHGFFVLLLSFLVLWLWVFAGYWRWINI